MGKAEIISHLGDGRYSARLIYDYSRSDAMIAAIDEQVALLDARIATLPDGQEKSLAQLQRAALLKRKEYLEANVIEEDVKSPWCADLTEDLSGIVGTIEVPGEIGIVQIQPGYDGNAAYDADRDGQMQGTAAGDPAAVFYNLAMLPGWQKWMPTYRYGSITAIDTAADTCTVELDTAQSSAQSLDINHLSVLYNVPIEYMSCNSGAFEVGDKVLVKFDSVKGQTVSNWATAKVIGFKEEPKECERSFFVKPIFNGLPAIKGSESLRLEYTFDGADYQLNGKVHGTRYDPGSYFLAGHAGPFELPDQSHVGAEITVRVSNSYSPGTGRNALYHGFQLVSGDDPYDFWRGYQGVTYYFKRVDWRPSAVKLADGIRSTVTVEGKQFDCYEIPFTDLYCTMRIPDETATNLWPKRYYDVSECTFNFEDNPAALGTVWSRVSPMSGVPAIYDYSAPVQWLHEIYIYDRDPGWNGRSPTIQYGAIPWGADLSHCFGQPEEDTLSEWIVRFNPPDNVGGAFERGLPVPFTVENSCILVDDSDGNNPTFANFISRQKYYLTAQIHSLNLGQIYLDVQQFVAEWSYEMLEQTDF
jgi:hypothetical protein